MGRTFSGYSVKQAAFSVAPVAAGAPICLFLPVQGGIKIPWIMGLTRLRISLQTAVEGNFGLTEPNNFPTVALGTQVTATEVSSWNGGNSGAVWPPPAPQSSGGGVFTSWTLAPTFAATPPYIERDVAPNIVGASLQWEWPEDDPVWPSLYAGTASSGRGLALQNCGAAASPQILITARWLEWSNGVIPWNIP
jgi:hypothetical protein